MILQKVYINLLIKVIVAHLLAIFLKIYLFFNYFYNLKLLLYMTKANKTNVTFRLNIVFYSSNNFIYIFF